MRIYIAAKFEDQERVRHIMEWLRLAGHVITHDWTANAQVNREQAQADLDGVMTADALLLVVEKHFNYCGALVEFGVALGRGIPIYVLGSALDERCIFMRLPELRRDISPLFKIPAMADVVYNL